MERPFLLVGGAVDGPLGRDVPGTFSGTHTFLCYCGSCNHEPEEALSLWSACLGDGMGKAQMSKAHSGM